MLLLESKLFLGLRELNLTTLITKDFFSISTYYKLNYILKNFYLYANKKIVVKNSNDGNEETVKTIKLINSDELKLLSTSLPSDILLGKTNVYDTAIIHYSNTLVYKYYISKNNIININD